MRDNRVDALHHTVSFTDLPADPCTTPLPSRVPADPHPPQVLLAHSRRSGKDAPVFATHLRRLPRMRGQKRARLALPLDVDGVDLDGVSCQQRLDVEELVLECSAMKAP